MTGQSDKPRLYLDANVLIELFEGRGERRSSLWRLFGGAEWPRWTLVTSELTLAEISVEPIRSADWERFNRYRLIIETKGDLLVAPQVTRSILELAANCRARLPSLRLPDAIHLATALETGCQIFLTNDRRLQNLPKQDAELGMAFSGFDVPDVDMIVSSLS